MRNEGVAELRLTLRFPPPRLAFGPLNHRGPQPETRMDSELPEHKRASFPTPYHKHES